MKISEYIKNYTLGKPVQFREVTNEVKEFLVELLKFNTSGVKEEFGDMIHFLQLWLYWTTNLDNSIWSLSSDSVEKFINRRRVWERIYVFVGLDRDVTRYCGNFKREQKVISHLVSLGISKAKAKEVFRKIVQK